jgi:RNase adaptor protein for sRNA GlmZ degradation
MRFIFLREIVKQGVSFITTHCYAHNFTNKATGLSDEKYLQKQKRIFTRFGARVCIVHLKASNETLLKRIKGVSRKQFKKLVDPVEMEHLNKKYDWHTSARVKNQLIIDTTHLKPEETVQKIINHFNLT